MKTIFLLTLSNVFMTFAWYAHLKDLRDKIAGSDFGQRSKATLAPKHKVLRGEPQGRGEHKPWVGEPLRLDFVWAGLCLVGAAYFMFRQPLTGGA